MKTFVSLKNSNPNCSDICLTDIVHDVIPASLVTAAITEVGIIPSTSVATVITENDKKRKDLEEDFED